MDQWETMIQPEKMCQNFESHVFTTAQHMAIYVWTTINKLGRDLRTGKPLRVTVKICRITRYENPQYTLGLPLISWEGSENTIILESYCKNLQNCPKRKSGNFGVHKSASHTPFASRDGLEIWTYARTSFMVSRGSFQRSSHHETPEL